MANLQHPSAQNMNQAVRSIADGCQALATEAARIQNFPAFDQGAQVFQLLQQVLNGQQQLQNEVVQLRYDVRQLRYEVGQLRHQVGEVQSQWGFPLFLFRRRSVGLTVCGFGLDSSVCP